MKSLRLASLLSAAFLVGVAAQTAPRQVTTIVSGGAVVTVDGERHIYNPGAVAIDGSVLMMPSGSQVLVWA